MKLSTRTEYAIGILSVLARSDKVMPLQVIAQEASLAFTYAASIMVTLRRAGMVRSVRGARGGYTLGRPAQRIQVLEIVEAVEGPVPSGQAYSCREVGCVYDHLRRGVRGSLGSLSLWDLMQEVQSRKGRR